MIGIFDLPHIPYWFSVSQAMKIIRVSFINTKKYPDPIAILVFDEKYNLLGMLSLRDILRGLEPELLKTEVKTEGSSEPEAPSPVWEALFGPEARKLAEKPVNEIMRPARLFAEPDDPVTKAAYLMLSHDLVLLPVLENKKKLVGLVRMIEVFDEASSLVLKE